VSDPVSASPPEVTPELEPVSPATLEKLRKRFLWGGGILVALYFNVYLIPMVFNTLVPFIALGGIGFFLGLSFPRKTNAASWCAFGLVLAASVVRRFQTFDVPLTEEIFGGALASGGYPPWAAWIGELLRLRVYLAALRLGARAGSQLRTLPSEGAE
jgi:hypothetical protein